MGSGLDFLQVPGSLSASDTISSLIGPAWVILPWIDSFPSASQYVTVMPGGRQSQKQGAVLLKEASPCFMDHLYHPFSLFYKLGTKQIFWTAVSGPMSLMTKDLITPLRKHEQLSHMLCYSYGGLFSRKEGSRSSKSRVRARLCLCIQGSDLFVPMVISDYI